MKVALVCDDLIQHGGHERIVMGFCEMFPDAPLYTTAVSKSWEKICVAKNINLVTTFVQKLPFIEKLNRFYSVFMLHILALQGFDFSKYDLVISLSSRFAHGVITRPQTLHVCYMSTPGRMFWEPSEYFKNESFGLMSFFKTLIRLFLVIPLHIIRLWDYVSAQRVDYFIANSVLTKRRIKKYYKRDSVVINPFINDELLSRDISQLNEDKDYFCVISRLVSWKKIDLAIEACKLLNKKLIIIGVGPDLARLRSIADKNKNIEFKGYVTESDKYSILSGCTALINTQREDFGIVPLEAMALGKAVIAYNSGGVLETVLSGQTGLFFEEQTVDSLSKAIKAFNPSDYSSADCKNQASKFLFSNFKANVITYLDSVYLKP